MPDLAQLHWLRPDMIWAAPLLLLTLLLLMRGRWQAQHWQRYIDPALLPYLLQGQRHSRPRLRLLSLATAALLLQLALLGPAWQQAPVTLYKNQQALAVVLDLSPSMLAEDLKPSRFQQASYKLRDLLALRQDGQTGLVVFSGDAFTVAPLTDDSNTLLTLLPGIYPGMMPVIGANPQAGIERAIALLDNGRGNNGQILLITDGVDDRQLPGIKKVLTNSPYPVSVLAVGTAEGAPIPLPDGGFARDPQGGIIVPRLDEDNLRTLANVSGGRYQTLTLDNTDIETLNNQASAPSETQASGDRRFDQWQDAGPWLVLLLLPFALATFRRSWLPSVVLVAVLGGHSETSQADLWQNLWRTPDQQGAALMDSDPAAAAQRFADPMWQGAAQYRAGNYAEAAQAFAQRDTADAHYNRGNALAQAGDLDGAIAAYDKALEKQPTMADAHANRQLLEEVKKQQEQQQQNQQPQSSGDQTGEGDQQQSGEQGGEKGGEQNPNSQNQQGGEGQPQPGQGDQNANNPQQGDQNSAGQQPGDQHEQAESPQPSSPDSADGSTDQTRQQQQEAAERYAQDAAEQSERNNLADEQSPQQGALDQGEQARDGADEKPVGAVASDEALSEDQQAKEQWLRKIPDNPAGLLERKFHYQSQQRSNRQEITEDDAYAPY
ncbi:VWA domain-containing protein [Spongiibacter taiwanensis]|uniref:VWA domain-containing protein n=1 Tax=Spongiibacter taiwanensis TaxID=1748242 RepID=UPI002035620E|nr:VWA domain-containing protein [Spongiibacter taiwanensis]USA42284.1 VWA domain-containing protein [Spongiibacter taiwanensis]